MRLNVILAAAVLAIPLSLLASSSAEEADPALPLAPEEPDGGVTAHYRILGGIAHQFQTDIDDTEQDFSLTRYGVGVRVRYPLRHTDFTIDHALVSEYDKYNFSSDAPWDDTVLVSYSLQFNYAVHRDWTLYAGPILGFAAETGADIGDAVSYGASAGVLQEVNPSLTLGLGVIALEAIEETTVIPVILVDWQMADGLRLRNPTPQPGLRGGAGFEVAYAITANWEVAGGLSYDTRRFRIDNENRVAENNSYPVFARTTYRPSDTWSLTAMVGVILGGELRLEDEDGHEIVERDYDPAPFVGLAAACRF